ncbi:hypothetical protein [Ottowia sp.]|uniref:hypothetical protein n=1 Tax=Ottowia sp. TaxID=1898956 RepID=UPI003A851B1E
MKPRHLLNDGAGEGAREQVVLLRHWAGVQDRVSDQMRTQTRRCEVLEAQLLRLRARWVVATTQWLWGLGWPVTERQTVCGTSAFERVGPQSAFESEPETAPELPHASFNHAADVICQTGCASHAHPWREDDGQCRLTGEACARVPVSSK